MGLTKRKGKYYVEFYVWDDGKKLKLARRQDSHHGARLQRWCTGSYNKSMAKKQEDVIKVELMTEKMESKKVRRDGPLTFEKLTECYLSDPRIRRQVIYQKKVNWINNRFRPHFGLKTAINAIAQNHIESYLESRRTDKGYQGTNLKVSTQNRELACLKNIFNWAIKRGWLAHNPTQFIQQEPEDNVRDEILEPEQFTLLQELSVPWLRPINLTAYYTAMREGEILNLTWSKVDLKKGFVRLTGEDTKTKEARIIPLTFTPNLLQTFRDLYKERPLHTDRVFLQDGKPVSCIREAYESSCKRAEISNFRFHDFRHTAITNMRRAGIDHLTIMKITGHKTMVCFTRYNSFREPDLLAAAQRFHTFATLHQNQAATTLPPSGTESALSC